jgi:hypothetical protein
MSAPWPGSQHEVPVTVTEHHVVKLPPGGRAQSHNPNNKQLGQTVLMGNPRHSDSIVVARAAEDLYDMVSDVTRMGEWSPVCKECWWEEGGAPVVGAWFIGRNEVPDRTWKTRSEVVVADRGREFAFIVGGSYARWGYTFTPIEGGTRITESWEFLPDAATLFEERFGAEAQAQTDDRAESARTGIAATLAAIKRSAESG